MFENSNHNGKNCYNDNRSTIEGRTTQSIQIK